VEVRTGVMATGVAYVRMFMDAREVETPLNVCVQLPQSNEGVHTPLCAGPHTWV
jgi:hypothetical protein